MKKFAEKNIDYIGGAYVTEVLSDHVKLENGNKVGCNVVVWATGADAQVCTAESDLDLLNGYFRVNKFMQSTSHQNVFAGGDCATIESHPDTPKAGIFAIRVGPFISQNLINYIAKKALVPYVPKTGFLVIFMTGDGKAIAVKFGLCFIGKWVWQLQDSFNKAFKDLFDPKNLFVDFESKGTAEPIKNYIPEEEDESKKSAQQLK